MIDLRCIQKKYNGPEGDIIPLNNLNLSVDDGEFISITGRSGCGKTTLLNLIGGMLKPTLGNICIDEEDIAAFNDTQLASFRQNKISYIFQDYLLEERLSVYQNIELALIVNKTIRKERSYIIEHALKAVGMLDKIHMTVGKLSGGEKQRVGIARAIAKGSKYILADEPCGNLDDDNANIVLNLLSDMVRDGKTVIMVTHNMQDASVADRILELKNGKLEEKPGIA